MTLSHLPTRIVIEPILGYLRGTVAGRGAPGQRPTAALPFVTISRQAGAGGLALGNRLVERLNAGIWSDERPWSFFDKELVEKVAADHHIAQELVDTLEHANRNWVEEFFNGMSYTNRGASELKVFHSLVSTVRALAQAGRVVIVGRGSVLITQHMPGGVHVRLVAPLEQRIANIMRLHGESKDKAALRVKQLDDERDAFLRRWWPNQPLVAECFTTTLNSGVLTEDQMVNQVLGLLKDRG